MNRIMAIFLSILSSLVIFFPFGNPVSDFLVTKKAEIYLEENYADKDYIVEEASYDFKTGSYYVNIKSPASADSSFTLYATVKGEITLDTYESAVLGKWNTAGRINDAYREAAKNMLENSDMPYEFDFGFGEIIFMESDGAVGEDIPEYAISTEELVLDGEYDISEMGKRAGKLTVYFYDEKVSDEKLAELLLAVKKAADEAGVTFRAIDCVLQYPNKEGEEWRDETASVSGFMYEDIYEEGLIDRIKAN